MTKAFFLRILFALVLSAGLLLAQPRRLTPDNLATIEFPETNVTTLFNGDDGFFVDVPGDAIRLVINLTSSPSISEIDLFVRFGQDPALGPDRTVEADFSSTRAGGVERIEITANSSPALQAGRYFIATRSQAGNPQTFGFLLASLETQRSTEGLTTVALSDFEDGVQGWSVNFPKPEPEIPLSTLGNENSKLSAPSVPRNEPRGVVLDGESGDAFVAPAKFLGNLALLGPLARIEFDLKHRAEDFPRTGVEVRIFGESSAFGWSTDPPETRFVHYMVPLQESAWRRLGGGASFEEVSQAVQRIEIRASFGGGPGETTLDNFELLGEVPIPLTPAMSDFEESLEGWEHNFPGAPFLIPRTPGATLGELRANGEFRRESPGGNPGGYLRIRDFDEEFRDFFVAPARFLGNLAALGPDARIEFDRFHQADVAPIRAVEVRMVGYGGAYRYRGSLPQVGWAHHVAPLDPMRWSRLSGALSFEETLEAVQRIEVSVDESAGVERSGLDNFQLLAAAPEVPMFDIGPEALSFLQVQGQAPPPGQPIEVTAEDEPVQWTATSSAPWIQLSQSAGTTPSMIVVTINPAGLGLGDHQGAIAIAAAGASEAPKTVEVNLTIISATTPRISSGGVVNAGDFTPSSEPGGEITGGMFVAIFGESLAGSRLQVSTVPFPVTLGGTSVTIGGLSAPMVFVSPLQLIVVVPQAVAGPMADVIVTRDGNPGPEETVRVAPVRPVLFSQSQTGSGPGAIQNILSGGGVELNTFQTPAEPGQAITLFGTGFGPTETFVPDGFASTGANRITAPASIQIGSVSVEPLFVGLSPQSPHLYQANAVIPADVATGCEVDIQILIDDVESNVVTLAITPDGQPCR